MCSQAEECIRTLDRQFPAFFANYGVATKSDVGSWDSMFQTILPSESITETVFVFTNVRTDQSGDMPAWHVVLTRGSDYLIQ